MMPSWEVKDYRDARDWYAERSVEAAARFIDAVDAAVRRIRESADALPVLSGKYRRVRVEKFPHLLVFYARTDREIRVVAVAHTSRRPGYWRRRD
jgi:plasmid stabilization system protein ParE